MQARANALPRDYRVVYGEMTSYLWRFTAGDGMDIVAVLRDVLEDFEASAADGRRALEVTGEDVAALLRCSSGRSQPYERYLQKWRASLNQDVARSSQTRPC